MRVGGGGWKRGGLESGEGGLFELGKGGEYGVGRSLLGGRATRKILQYDTNLL